MESEKTNSSSALSEPIEMARDLPESSNPEVRRHCREGDEFAAAGDSRPAERAYRAALELDADCVRVQHNLGVVLYWREDWEEAGRCFERCVELAPQEADHQFKLGLSVLKGERDPDAAEAFECAVRLDPDHLPARFHLALLYARGGGAGSDGRQKAVSMLRGILEASDGGVPCPNLDRVCFLLGSFLDDSAEHRQEAIAVYRRGLKADPLFAPGHNNLGVLLMESGQAIQALGEFKIAIHLEPDYTLPYRNLARLLFVHMSPAQMEREYTSTIEEFGVRSASVLARLSLELIDLGRAQVYEGLYTRGHQIKNLMGMAGSRMRRLLRGVRSDAEWAAPLGDVADEHERIYDQWVTYLRSMKQTPVNPVLVDVPNLVRKAVDSLSGRKGSTDLDFASEARIPQVKADSAMLREAVTNLIINALEAVGGDDSVKVQTGYDREGASVYVEVEDNGPGIPMNLQARIFDPGFSTKEKGSGYGLSICSRIVSAHRGNLRVVSRPSKGAVFRIDLPVDFELVSEEESIGLQGGRAQTSLEPIADELID